MSADSLVKPHMREALKDHVLKIVHKDDWYQCYRMGRPGHGAYAVYITFMNHGVDPAGVTPRGKMIVIAGDISLCEHTNAVGSNYGYDFGWFSGELSERYLCEKFLRKCWSKEAAIRDLKDEAADIRANKESDALDLKIAEDLEQLAHDTDVGDLGPDDIYHSYTDLMGSDDYSIGHDYPLAEAGWLCAIQQRFRELLPTVA